MTSPTDDLPDSASLKKLRVADLKELLEARGLDSTGKKDDLVARLDATRVASMEGDDDAAAAAAIVSGVDDPETAADDAEAADAEEQPDETDAAAAAAAPKPLALHVSEATGQQGGGAAAAGDGNPAGAPAGAGPAGPKVYVGFLGENCNRQFIIDMFREYFTPEKIFIATQQRGHLKVPKGYAFVDGPAGEWSGKRWGGVEK